MRRMRIVILISVILTINCMLVVSAEDRPMIVLDNETYADVFGNVSHVSELYYENGAIKVTFTPGGNDPYIYLPLSLMGDIPCNITVWMRTRMYVHRSTERMANGR
jgi:hypothetical protein